MAEKSHAFRRSQRLSGRRAFAAVYDVGVKHARGPLVLFSKPNDLPDCRWGLSVSRRVGNAVRRNRVKRLLRESIRLLQHESSGAYDLIIVVRPHQSKKLAEYQDLVSALLTAAAAHWTRDRTNAP